MAQRAWRAANPERVAALRKKHRAAQRAASKAYWSAPERAEALRAKRYRAAHAWRARRRGAYVEPVDAFVVFERDGGRCGICGLSIVRADTWHLDHIVPLARGGAHSYANVQLAHPRCNSLKGTKLMDELRKAG